MNLFVLLVAGCIIGGVYAVFTGYLPLTARRKLIDAHARRFGVVLILLPIINAGLFVLSRWGATAAFPGSSTAEHWSIMVPLVAFPLSLALALVIAKRWSVPKYYDGTLLDYKPPVREPTAPDLAFLAGRASDSETPD